MPFETGPADAVHRAILLHGYSGSAYEMRPLGDALAEAGVACTGLLLPAHGTTPMDLAKATAHAFLEHAQRALFAASTTRPVALVGLSTGALIQACLAARYPERISALVLVAPALRLFPRGQAAIAAARLGLGKLMPTSPKEHPGGDCGDDEGRARNTGYPVITIGGLPALGDLQRLAARELPRVRAPTLVLHGDMDQTVPAAVGAEVASLLSGARAVEHVKLPRSHHLVPLDVERDQACDAVLAFLRRHGAAA